MKASVAQGKALLWSKAVEEHKARVWKSPRKNKINSFGGRLISWLLLAAYSKERVMLHIIWSLLVLVKQLSHEVWIPITIYTCRYPGYTPYLVRLLQNTWTELGWTLHFTIRPPLLFTLFINPGETVQASSMLMRTQFNPTLILFYLEGWAKNFGLKDQKLLQSKKSHLFIPQCLLLSQNVALKINK